MERLHAACANSEVVRMVFQHARVVAKLDTRDDITFPANVTSLADFFKLGRIAGPRLALVFATKKDDVVNVDPRYWTQFTCKTSLIHISGTLHPKELLRLVKAFEHVKTLNILNQKYLDNGSLVGFSRWIPPSVKNFM